MKAKKVMEFYGINRDTLCRWVKNGKIKHTVLPNGRYDYDLGMVGGPTVEEARRRSVLYCRVSTSSQKDNLTRQVERVKSFASARGIVVDKCHQEIASALNYNRREYRKLYNDVANGEIDKIVIEYKDRLLRIGFDDFAELCKIKGTELIVIDESTDQNKQSEIVNDLVSIIHHFSSKIYSSRRKKNLENLIKEFEQSDD